MSAGLITSEESYREAIMHDVGGVADEDENPNNPETVPGFFLLDKETIRTEGGPVEAAAASIAEFFNRGARQIKEYRSRLKRGELKFNPLERESEGLYHLHFDFTRLVMTKTLSIKPEWVAEIQALLKQRNLAEARARFERRNNDNLSVDSSSRSKVKVAPVEAFKPRRKYPFVM